MALEGVERGFPRGAVAQALGDGSGVDVSHLVPLVRVEGGEGLEQPRSQQLQHSKDGSMLKIFFA